MQPYKQILLFIALLTYLCPQSIEAQQNLKFDIVKFELNQLDGTASNKNYEKIDGSGNKYAIIRCAPPMATRAWASLCSTSTA